MHLQAGNELAQFGRDRIGRDQQAPMTLFDRAGLYRAAKWRGQQAADGFVAAAGGAHAVHQAGQRGGLLGAWCSGMA